jgi:crotonobetainyl-CoA:carnitine CoA-transferase CaiB-like acyl-CoA transferase
MTDSFSTPPAVRGPLQGIRVVDLTSTLLGPYATQILADFGAEVIKVEAPDGDIRRQLGAKRHEGMTSQYLTVNRGKRNLVLDLKRPQAREVVLRLCAGADVFVHNSRREAMARLGLDYPAVAAANPRIVYCAAVGFGAGGPYAGKPAYDDLIQGLTALPALQERAGGIAGFVPMNLADRVCALALVNVLTAALLYRERSGEGQAVELPMFETMAEFVLSEHMWGHVFVPPAEDMGAVRLFDRRPARTRDGYVCHWIATDAQYARFVTALGFPEMKDDPRFARRAQRYRNLPAFQAFVDEQLGRRTTAECIAMLESADIPAMPMHTLESLMEDPHLRARGFFRRLRHPTEGEIVSMAVPSVWSKSVPRNDRPAAPAGAHTREVLAEAGYDEDAIAALIASGAARTAAAADRS